MSTNPAQSSSTHPDDNRPSTAAVVPSEASISPSDLLTPRYEQPPRDPGRTPRYVDEAQYSSVSHYAMDDEEDTDDRPSYFDIPRRTAGRTASDPQAEAKTRSSPPSPSHSAAPSAVSLQSLTISNGSRVGMDNFPNTVLNDIRRPRPSSRSGPGQTPPLPGPTIPHVYRPRKHTMPIAASRPDVEADTQPPLPYRPYRNIDVQRRGSPNQSIADKSINSSGLNVNPGSPALSPGLFTPPSRRSDSRDFDEGDSQYRTPQLHPTHIGAPKETNYLQKNIDPLTGRRMFNNYEIIRTLGKGAHGTVKLAANKETNSPVAIKILRRSAKKRLGKEAPVMDQIKKEVAVLKQARHPHIVPLLEVIDDAEIDKVYLILEFMEKGEVKWRDETLKEIAEFELARVKREKAGTTIEEEQRIIADFNADLAQRREFRLAKTAVQHAIATERLRTDNSNREKKERQKRQKRPKLLAEDALRHWSLEHGGESDEEEDSTEPSSGHVSVPMYSRASSTHRGSTSQREYTVPSEQASAIFPVNSEAASVVVSAAGSRAASPTRLLLEKAIDQDEPKTGLQPFEVMLEKVIAEQTAWTAEEEEFRYVPRLNLAGIRSVFRDTLLGLEYLHYQGIIHRDIKPANLLYTADYRVMISDFGVSYLGKPLDRVDRDHKLNADAFDAFEAVELARTVGTPAFYAPELCNRDNYLDHAQHSRPKITGSIDVWALGTTLYGMVFGRLPFHDENEFVMYDKIAKEELFIPSMRLKPVLNGEVTPNTRNQRAEDVLDYDVIDPSLRDLLTRMLAKDPKDRITVKALKRHEWVIRGMENPEAWIDENDPSKGGHAKKIEVSSKDLETAVAPVSFALAGFIKKGITRLGSVVRGRGNRKRADSSAASSDVETKSTTRNRPASTHSRSKATVPVDEAIQHALLASKHAHAHAHDHPLAHSEVSSPTLRDPRDTFLPLTAPTSPDFGGPLEHVRPATEMANTSESIATVRNLRLNKRRESQYETQQVDRDRSVRATLRGLFEGSRPSSRAKEQIPEVTHEFQTQWRTTNMFDEPNSHTRNAAHVHASASLAVSNATATVAMDNPLTRTVTQTTAERDAPKLKPESSLSPHATTNSDPDSEMTSSTGTTLPEPIPFQHASSNASREPSPRRASSALSASALSLNSMAMSLSQFTTPSTMLSSVISSPSLEEPTSSTQRPASLEAHLHALETRTGDRKSSGLNVHPIHHRGSSGADKPLTEAEKAELNTSAPVLGTVHRGSVHEYEDDDDEDDGLTF